MDSHLHTTMKVVVCLDSIIDYSTYSSQREETATSKLLHQTSDTLQVGHSQQLRRVVRKTEQTSELGVH